MHDGEVGVGAGGVAGGAHVADQLAGGHPLADGDDRCGDHVAVERDEAVAMVDLHHVTVARVAPAGEGDGTGGGRQDRCALDVGDVEAEVEVVEAVVGWFERQ